MRVRLRLRLRVRVRVRVRAGVGVGVGIRVRGRVGGRERCLVEEVGGAVHDVGRVASVVEGHVVARLVARLQLGDEAHLVGKRVGERR